jgi:hypothetical protein
MKYYCENCGSEFVFQEFPKSEYCPICWNDVGNYPLTSLPDYETPDEYKARTGRELSGKAQVWWRSKINGIWLPWTPVLFGDLGDLYPEGFQTLVGGPEPPPDDWKGE